MKNALTIPIIVSLTIIVLAVISQQVTMALYFSPSSNTLINQEGENLTNQTTPLPSTHVSNQATTPLPLPFSNQTTTATPLPTSPTTPPHVSNQTSVSNSPSLLSYFDPTFKFKVSYPLNFTKYGVLNLNLHKITNIGHE